jgi:hypothetical protein
MAVRESVEELLVSDLTLYRVEVAPSGSRHSNVWRLPAHVDYRALVVDGARFFSSRKNAVAKHDGAVERRPRLRRDQLMNSSMAYPYDSCELAVGAELLTALFACSRSGKLSPLSVLWNLLPFDGPY